MDIEALFKISYGLYIVASGTKAKGNAYISNTLFQVTATPARFVTCCSKENYTVGLIKNTGAFSASVLKQDASSDLIGRLGYHSGKNTDKMSGLDLYYGKTGAPIVRDESIATFEFKVIEVIDAGTHLMFLADLVNAVIIDEGATPLTYAYYREVKKGKAPKNAPTYVEEPKLRSTPKNSEGKSYKCTVCGYIFEEENESCAFGDLPSDYLCPICGAGKEEFIEI
jgi:flavin reductase (DIM6/NTAB) family NADH-FMN oxidoreductase RutF/rubredoxin